MTPSRLPTPSTRPWLTFVLPAVFLGLSAIPGAFAQE